MNKHIHVCQQLDKPFKLWKAEVVTMVGQALLWKKYYNKLTYLYCDSNTSKILEDLGVLDVWDVIDSTSLDETIDINRTRFWSSGKIRVMSMQTEPYVMSDLDMICFDNLHDSKFFNVDFGAYHRELWLMNAAYSNPRGKLNEARFKMKCKSSWFANPYNMSFIAMNNMELNRQFTSNSLEYMVKASQIETPSYKNNQYTVFAEQYMMAAIIKANNYTNLCAIKAAYQDNGLWFNTCKGMWSLQDNWNHSIHLWLDKYNFATTVGREDWYIDLILTKLEGIDHSIANTVKGKLSNFSRYKQYYRD